MEKKKKQQKQVKKQNCYYSDINIYSSKHTSLPVLTGCNCQTFSVKEEMESLGSLTVDANTRSGLI